MRRHAPALIVLGVLALASGLVPGADAGRVESHTGTVVSMDAERGQLVIDEVGPWRVERGATVLTRRTIRVTPSTEYRMFMRADVPGEYPGDFIEVVLDASDVQPGYTVTAECVREGDRLIALAVILAEL